METTPFYEPAKLYTAWQTLKAKQADKKGAVQREIAEMEEKLEAEIAQLYKELASGRYLPEPYREIEIPKGKGEVRTLGLAPLRDKWAQQALLSEIEPPLEKMFLDSSYGYRKGKGPERAVRRVWDYIANRHKAFFLRCDFDAYFDSLPWERLSPCLEKYVPDTEQRFWLMLFLKMGRISVSGEWKDTEKGIPQGALLSPLVANLYLHEFDLFMQKQPLGYVRYADDFVVLAKTLGELNDIVPKIMRFVEQKLGLGLNPDKISQGAVAQGFEFLGISFSAKGYGLGQAKMADLSEKIRLAVGLDAAGNWQDTLWETLNGIAAYYGRLLSETELMVLDNQTKAAVSAYINHNRERFPTQKSIRECLGPLVFLSAESNISKQAWIKTLYVSRRKPKAFATEQLDTFLLEKLDKRKQHHYEQRARAGTDLVVSTAGVRIGISGKGITVYKGETCLVKVPTAQVKHITVSSEGFSLSSNLLFHCQKNKIGLDVLEPGGKVLSTFHFSDVSDTALWLAQQNAVADGKAAYLCRQWVKAKIRNQRAVLNMQRRSLRQSEGHPFLAAAQSSMLLMEEMLQKVDGQIELVPLGTLAAALMGYEGTAAKAYWEAMALRLPAKWGFEGRITQGATDAFNMALNYGYAILYAKVWAGLMFARLNPHIGYLHTQSPDKPALVYDMIEEFRQAVVDRELVVLFQEKGRITLEKGKLSAETRRHIASRIYDRLAMRQAFRGEDLNLLQIIYSQALHLCDYLRGEVKVYLPYKAKW